MQSLEKETKEVKLVVPSYWELAWVFLRLGSLGFGGPVALVSLMEQEVSSRRSWITLAEFNETYVFCKLLPGPLAFQMAVWVGYRLLGRLGGLLCAVTFLIPGALMILAMSVFYGQLLELSRFELSMQGMRAGALALIAESVYRMYRPYRKLPAAWAFLILSCGLMLALPRFEPFIIIVGGFASVLLGKRFQSQALASVAAVPLSLFWVHFKGGAVVFGTGLAMLPYLQHQAVDVYHWLTNAEFVDGIAFGQITPGPVTITSVFIGYKAASYLGALSALVGMYLPGTLMMLLILPVVRKQLQRAPWLPLFQRGAIPSVIGCIVGASITLGVSTLTNYQTVVIFIACLLLALSGRIAGWMLIPLGSIARLFLPV